VFAGGEPTLLGEDLLNSIAHANSLGIMTRLVTNVYWASTPQRAREGMTALRQAGLRELNISYDDYHLPFIKPINLKHAYTAAYDLGFDTIVFANSFHKNSVVKPEFIQNVVGAPLAIVYRDEGDVPDFATRTDYGTLIFIHAPSVQALGRFHSTRGREGIEERSLDELESGCPHAIRSAAISPEGNLLSCCGTELAGNPVLDFGPAYDGSFKRALASADDDVIVQAICRKGPAFLAKFAQAKDKTLSFRPTYGSVCEVCEDVVTRPDVIKVLREYADEITDEMLAVSGA